jgi:hypothetical protein
MDIVRSSISFVLRRDPFHVFDVDAAVARLDDAEIEALLFQFHQMNQRAFEVQLVGDDVAIELLDAEGLDDQVFAGAGVGDVADLGGLRVDELCERALRIRARGAAARRASPGAPPLQQCSAAAFLASDAWRAADSVTGAI